MNSGPPHSGLGCAWAGNRVASAIITHYVVGDVEALGGDRPPAPGQWTLSPWLWLGAPRIDPHGGPSLEGGKAPKPACPVLTASWPGLALPHGLGWPCLSLGLSKDSGGLTVATLDHITCRKKRRIPSPVCLIHQDSS